MCCAVADTCLGNGLCKNGDLIWRESCTDRTWQAPECVKLFLNGTGYGPEPIEYSESRFCFVNKAHSLRHAWVQFTFLMLMILNLQLTAGYWRMSRSQNVITELSVTGTITEHAVSKHKASLLMPAVHLH